MKSFESRKCLIMELLIKLVLLASILQTFSQAELTVDRAIDNKWKQFKATHRKVYKDPQEEARRKKIYEANLKHIETSTLTSSNGHKNLFTLAENALADMTKGERDQLKQLKIPKKQLSVFIPKKTSVIKDKKNRFREKYGRPHSQFFPHEMEADENENEDSSELESQEDDNDDDEYTKPTTAGTAPQSVTTLASSKFQNPRSTPDSVDYRDNPCAPPIDNQGNCGSCYAFAAITCVEWAACQKSASKQLTLYSEQQIVDCSSSSGNLGCNGGHYFQVWTYMKKTPVLRERDYAYTSRKGTCKRSKLQSERRTAIKVANYTTIKAFDEEAMKDAIATHGFIAVAVDASPSSFDFYSSGIYNEIACADAKSGNSQVNHAMVLVGYGIEEKKKYWVVRNTWGNTWGIQGYMKMLRGNNTCNVAMLPAYPNVN